MTLGGARQVGIMHTCSLSDTPVIHVANIVTYAMSGNKLVWKHTSFELNTSFYAGTISKTKQFIYDSVTLCCAAVIALL